MSYVFQTARYEINRQIKSVAHLLTGKVLDVGSGSVGRYKSLFTEATEYVKLDIDGNVDVVGSADAIPLPNNSFDNIVCTQVLTCVFAVSKAFEEMHRVLKPGGYAVITEPLFDPIHHPEQDQWRFTHNSLRTLAEQAGFSVVTLEQRGGFWSVGHQMINRYFLNRFDIYDRWYRPIYSFFSKATGAVILWIDRLDTSKASHIFTHGYLLIARKPIQK